MLERVWRARDRVRRLGEGDVGDDGVRAALEWPALLRKLDRIDPSYRSGRPDHAALALVLLPLSACCTPSTKRMPARMSEQRFGSPYA